MQRGDAHAVSRGCAPTRVRANRASNVINLEIANIEVTGIPTGTLIELNSIRGSSSVHHCYLHDCGTAILYGMQPQTTGIEIDNNKIFAELSRGIDVHDNHIIDIAFGGPALGQYGGQTDGVNLQDGTGMLVHDNYMRNVGEGVDIFASDCSIHGNVLVDCYHAGVKLIHGASRNNVHHNVAGGSDASDSNTFARNRITGGSQMMYAIRNEAGTDNRFIDNEAERWGGVPLEHEDPPAYSSVKGGSATIINAKKTLVRVCAGSNQPLTAEFMFDVSDTLEVAPRDTVDVTLQHDSTSSRIISGNSLLSYLRIEEVAG